MTVYVDVVFFENLLLNYIILYATAIIGNSKVSFLKFLLSSVFGGVYSILNYIIEISFLENFFLKLFISCFMILVSFNNKDLKTIFKNLIMFYMTSLTFGGAAFMLLFFISPDSVVYENGHFVGIYPIEMAIAGCILGFIIIAIVAKIIKSRLLNNVCEIEIVFNKKILKIKTLIDSGNFLKEPITNQDVIIVEKRSLEEIIDKKILDEALSIVNGNLIGDMSEEFYRYRFKVIPFSSLGNENGVLVGFKPDYIKIINEDEFIKEDIIVGIYDGELAKSNLNYSGLIGTKCFEKEERKNEYIASA